jgi:integrase
VLSLAELRDSWASLLDDDYGRIVKLLTLTAQRANEIAGLHRSELQGDGIQLPAERTKNGRAHFVPLAPAAYEIIRTQLAQQDPTRGFLFGRREAGAFGNWSRCKRKLDKRITVRRGEALTPWVVHDLRRSAITHMAEIGIAPHVVEAIANHVSGSRAGVAGVYNRAQYESEKRTALNRWAEHLLAVVEGRDSNVTSLRRGA